ncbi:hypothetical protein AXG93_2356s1020 [Marchantia polymorpha subsp. ruderalis]|uniref:Uncharacterized protein n=1 Tax=Marchantia polymorpha subsp. ruderalis TaxID=1480154 RepID=A0A176WDP2_MARPO|nr:hypothetical protein AXG93_2356s1020 [Marchantia polymorpha subsp. ruderalis]
MRSQELQRRMEKAEEAYCQLQEESIDELKLRLEKCIVEIVELVNTFSEVLNESRQNVEVEIVNMLRRIGVDVSSHDAVTATSDGTAPQTDSSQAVDIPLL